MTEVPFETVRSRFRHGRKELMDKAGRRSRAGERGMEGSTKKDWSWGRSGCRSRGGGVADARRAGPASFAERVSHFEVSRRDSLGLTTHRRAGGCGVALGRASLDARLAERLRRQPWRR